MSIVVRPAQRSDAAQLIELVRQLNVHQRDPTQHFTAEVLDRDVFSADAYLGAIVAEYDGRLVGYAFFHDGYDSGHAQRGLYLCDLFVDPHERRKGIGRALVAACARVARERGRSFLWWASHAWNTEAHAFYERLGARSDPVFAHALMFEAFEAMAGNGDAEKPM